MNAGDTFRLSGVADKHVWVVLSDPSVDPDVVLFANFTSFDKYVDQSCILEAGVHPRITNKTCVEYGRARTATDAELELLRASDRLKVFEPIGDELLAHIRSCAMRSSMATDNQQILIDQGLVS